jgi:hypothetical protein
VAQGGLSSACDQQQLTVRAILRLKRGEKASSHQKRNIDLRLRLFGLAMKNFSNAAFSPEIIRAMTAALESSVAALPEPVSSTHVSLLAESILRTAQAGETDPSILQRIALLELSLSTRSK